MPKVTGTACGRDRLAPRSLWLQITVSGSVAVLKTIFCSLALTNRALVYNLPRTIHLHYEAHGADEKTAAPRMEVTHSRSHSQTSVLDSLPYWQELGHLRVLGIKMMVPGMGEHVPLV